MNGITVRMNKEKIGLQQHQCLQTSSGEKHESRGNYPPTLAYGSRSQLIDTSDVRSAVCHLIRPGPRGESGMNLLLYPALLRSYPFVLYVFSFHFGSLSVAFRYQRVTEKKEAQ